MVEAVLGIKVGDRAEFEKTVMAEAFADVHGANVAQSGRLPLQGLT